MLITGMNSSFDDSTIDAGGVILALIPRKIFRRASFSYAILISFPFLKNTTSSVFF